MVTGIMSRRQKRNALDQRSRDILESTVRLNIETGRAVSSGLVERCLQRSVSSATIRTVMKNLEADGYLEQPHPSAGRLPTDRGFRAFVDTLRAGWALRRFEAPTEMRALAQRDVKRTRGAQGRLRLLAGLLSRLTDNISIIVGPSRDSARVERVEFYPRSEARGLLVVILDSTQVRTRLVKLPSRTPTHVAIEAVRFLNERVAGRTPAEIRTGVLKNIDLAPTPVSVCAGRMAHEWRELLTEPAVAEIAVEGVAQLLDTPELHDPVLLRSLLRFMESPRAIGESLRRLHGKSREDFGVWIGHENPVGDLRSFSVLTGTYRLDGRVGTLAVLGPRRMSYQRAFHGIDILRETLGQDPAAFVS